MNILITGATGFVGSHLYSALRQNHELFVLTRKSSNVKDISPDHFIEFSGDVDALTSYMIEKHIDGVIHLATKYVAEHKSDDIKDLVLSNILLGTYVLEAATNAKVSWFINTGTIWQNYNVPDYSDEYCPVNLYAASKQAFMTMAKYYTEISPIKFTTLKLCDTYGPNDTRRKIMDLFAENAMTGDVLEMSAGEQLIDIVHIDKVIKAFKSLIDILSDSTAPYRNEYVVTSNRQITLKELAFEYERQHNVKLNIEWGKRPYRKREVMKPYKGVAVPMQ